MVTDEAEPHLSSSGVESTDVASSLCFVDEVAKLSAIFTTTTNVVALKRTPSDALVSEAARATQTPGFSRSFEVAPDAWAQTLTCELEDFPHLAADVQFWSEVLVDLTGCESVGVRFAVMTSAMCPRLHVDKVGLRLVMTYHGPGTEFVSNDDVDRQYLGYVAGDTGEQLDRLLRTPDCIRKASTFDVVLLKGESWPDNEGAGAVHRSPAMATGSSPRLVMTLDPL